MNLSLLYTHSTSIGYGRLGTLLAEALTSLGVDVYDDLGVPPKDRARATEARERVGRRLSPEPTNVVSWVSVPSHARWWYQGQFTSVFTMWEAAELPPTFRDALHEFDVLMVPSNQNVELFSKYHPNVLLNPLGIDPARWHPIDRPDRDQFFTFLIGGSGKRKGTDLTFKAFRTVFGDWNGHGPEPRLVMKNPKGESQFVGWDRVSMVPGRLTDQEEVDLYASAHVYVQPSRGEGFGLQPLQAMAQGMPTILTDAHGHSSFSKYATHPLGWSWAPAEYFIYGHAGDWWEPDFDELCESMWDCYQNYDKHLAHAQKIAGSVIPQQFTWRECASRFIDAHNGELSRPYKGDGTHVFPIQDRFLVRVTREYDADIAGFMYQWFPGKDYYEPADVKRILFERGVLDPSCLEGDDIGLAPVQIEKLGAYSAAQEHCALCGQVLNTLPTKADAIYAEMEEQARMVSA